MQQFIEKYRDEVTGVLSGFDRLVFRASPRRLNYGCFDKNLALSRNSTLVTAIRLAFSSR
jgi:hypothetical protein